MCRAVIIILLICYLFCPMVTLLAQDFIISPYEPHNFLLKLENLFRLHFAGPETNPVEPIQMEPNPHKPFYLILQEHVSFDNYLRWRGLGLPKTWLPEIDSSCNTTVNREVFNVLYNKPRVDEKKMLRQAWKEAFGIDVWYPYYKAKDVERWVKKRLSVKVFKLKGEPQFARDQFLYTFKATF